MSERARAVSVLTMNTAAFAVCFAAWMMNGVLVTFLVDNRVFDFDKAEMGWLIGIPVLTGSLLRLPLGVLTDRYGGRLVFAVVMLVSAAAAYLTSFAAGFWGFFFGGLAFGLCGASFAVGIAYTSLWFPPSQQGTALGIFGAGTTGAALTSLFAPRVLHVLTEGGIRLEAWRQLPRLYAALLVATTVVYWLFTHDRRAEGGQARLSERLAPLRVLQVWRFGLYYFLVFGGFVALAQWLIPYYVNVYTVSVATAGALATAYSLPSGLFRAVGGWLADRHGARTVMYWVLGGCTACCLLLMVPRMDVYAPGEGIMALAAGRVEVVSPEAVVVDGHRYALRSRPAEVTRDEGRSFVWPQWAFWQEAAVREGDEVQKRQLLARGVTHVYFQANRNIFTGIVFLLAFFMGIGMAAVYKHIPTYFPREVGVVGGLVGVLGGLGGFLFPILFGYLLKGSGIWTTCWMFFFLLSLGCLVWMHRVVQRVMAEGAPRLAREMDEPNIAAEMEHVARELKVLAGRMKQRPTSGDA